MHFREPWSTPVSSPLNVGNFALLRSAETREHRSSMEDSLWPWCQTEIFAELVGSWL